MTLLIVGIGIGLVAGVCGTLIGVRAVLDAPELHESHPCWGPGPPRPE
jgi:hypothetical protein